LQEIFNKNHLFRNKSSYLHTFVHFFGAKICKYHFFFVSLQVDIVRAGLAARARQQYTKENGKQQIYRFRTEVQTKHFRERSRAARAD